MAGGGGRIRREARVARAHVVDDVTDGVVPVSETVHYVADHRHCAFTRLPFWYRILEYYKTMLAALRQKTEQNIIHNIMIENFGQISNLGFDTRHSVLRNATEHATAGRVGLP